MRIEIQSATEGVRYYHDESANTISDLEILFDDRGRQCRQVVKKVPILSKKRPKGIRHCKGNPQVRNIGQGGPLLTLPQNRGSIPATGTGSRFASVRNDFLLGFGAIYLRSQRHAAAESHLLKILANAGAELGTIPVVAGCVQNLFQ